MKIDLLEFLECPSCQWFEEAGLVEIEMRLGYNGINVRGRRPLSHDHAARPAR
jgi:hypothetical protein